MLKILIVHQDFVIPKNKCGKKSLPSCLWCQGQQSKQRGSIPVALQQQ
jgi:hypothetical protein